MTVRYSRPPAAHVPWPVGKGEPEEAAKEPAARHEARYRCGRCGIFTLAFAAGALAPDTWDCRCGQAACLEGAGELAEGSPRPAAYPAYPTTGAGRCERPCDGLSHRQQLAKRRTDAELEAILAERLAEVRQQRGAA